MDTAADVVVMADPRVVGITVVDNGEPLVDLRLESLGYDGSDDAGAQVRAGLASRLRAADRALPDGLRLLVREGFRSAALQERYFEQYRRTLRDADPDLDEPGSRPAASSLRRRWRLT